jgi:phosphoribosylpyrophosphate synthetase
VTAASRTKPQTPDATDLALPILLAIASGLLVGLVVLAVAGLWVRWSGRRRALSSYVASRTVRRRREGTMVILPITAALTVAVFAVGVSLAASTWRSSTAATQVGAPMSYSTHLSLSRAVGLTHQLDPNGRWLMAAGQDFPNPDEATSTVQPRVIVDATRLGRVASWPTQWTPGRSAADVARAIGPRRPPILLRGSELTMTVANRVDGDVTGRMCVLVDDMIDTGGTIVKAAEALMADGAAGVVIAATHAILSDPAVDRLKNCPAQEVVVTNTLPLTPDREFDKLTQLSIAPLVARAIREVFEDGSVTSMFDGHA